ncbi:MAG: ATP-binding cassette domain-containing protein [Bifidobacteriaceae bacterium]|nr:ATP-binding cassette domain-containing protein [Bifidobacteriaceae bacterium]
MKNENEYDNTSTPADSEQTYEDITFTFEDETDTIEPTIHEDDEVEEVDTLEENKKMLSEVLSKKSALDSQETDDQEVPESAVENSSDSLLSTVDKNLNSNNSEDIILRANPTLGFNDVSYARNKKEEPIINNFSAKFYTGRTYAIKADNSAQVAALLGVTICFTLPQNGSITIKGTNIASLDHAKTRLNRLGIIPQKFALRPDLTAVENLTYVMSASNRNFLRPIKDIALALLEQCGYNGGSKIISDVAPVEQRIASIARAIACEPEIIIADDPLRDLNNEDANRVSDLLNNLAKNTWPQRVEYANHKHCIIILTQNDSYTGICDETLTL